MQSIAHFRFPILLDVVDKTPNAHTCVKIYYKHSVPPIYFGHSRGHLQGHKLQKMDTLKFYEVREPKHRYKIPSSKNTWFKIYITI